MYTKNCVNSTHKLLILDNYISRRGGELPQQGLRTEFSRIQLAESPHRQALTSG